ncbi:transcription elongation factor greA [Streptococcus pneumoniae 2061376]|nr:transcription elongation factor greA [Streptococcus pneumoniae 2061376]
MAEKTYPMTLEEKEKLEKELEELKLVRRPEVVERIKIARSYGDLSENSEYEAAKDEQAFVEGQISSLETKIRYAEIVNSDAVAQDEVAIGKTVTIQEIGEDEEEVYIIVGSAGADAFAGKVSNESPIGQALIGKKTGDTATIETPVGSYDVKILKVEKNSLKTEKGVGRRCASLTPFSILLFFENLFKPRQRRLAVCMVTDFVSFIYNLKTVF